MPFSQKFPAARADRPCAYFFEIFTFRKSRCAFISFQKSPESGSVRLLRGGFYLQYPGNMITCWCLDWYVKAIQEKRIEELRARGSGADFLSQNRRDQTKPLEASSISVCVLKSIFHIPRQILSKLIFLSMFVTWQMHELQVTSFNTRKAIAIAITNR